MEGRAEVGTKLHGRNQTLKVRDSDRGRDRDRDNHHPIPPCTTRPTVHSQKLLPTPPRTQGIACIIKLTHLDTLCLAILLQDLAHYCDHLPN